MNVADFESSMLVSRMVAYCYNVRSFFRLKIVWEIFKKIVRQFSHVNETMFESSLMRIMYDLIVPVSISSFYFSLLTFDLTPLSPIPTRRCKDISAFYFGVCSKLRVVQVSLHPAPPSAWPAPPSTTTVL
jgi:hypothetical protein